MYCLDSYALWEIQFGNEKFSGFLTEKFVITDWTFVEFYRTLLREYNKKTADYWFRKFKPYIRKVNIDILIKAVLFQYENKKRRMSLFDCVGYLFSKENNLKFLTGDKEFKHREGAYFTQK